ncbi:MAG TPA: hypothetical protein VJ813_19915, partial [Vicinamibacterales bacterium]|nr:hypothetical protein [Vicinamibacterales bacterium]
VAENVGRWRAQGRARRLAEVGFLEPFAQAAVSRRVAQAHVRRRLTEDEPKRLQEGLGRLEEGARRGEEDAGRRIAQGKQPFARKGQQQKASINRSCPDCHA